MNAEEPVCGSCGTMESQDWWLIEGNLLVCDQCRYIFTNRRPSPFGTLLFYIVVCFIIIVAAIYISLK